MSRLLPLMLAMTLYESSYASASAYKCVVESRLTLNDGGELENGESGFYVGKDFVVDKATGRMSGILTNHGGFGQPTVKDYGSSKQAFKVVTEFTGYTKIDYLFVKEYVEQDHKPFIFITSDEAFSGLCRDY